MQMQTSPFDMPLSFRAGIGADLCQGMLFEPQVDANGVLEHSLVAAVDFETFSDTPEQFDVFIRAEQKRWANVVEKAKISID